MPSRGRWDKSIENYRPWDNGCVRVGVMGFGAMGRAAARLLLAAGYDVAAWARTPRGGRQQQEEVQQQQGDVPGTAQGQEAAAGPGLSGGGAGGPGTEDSELARVRVYAGRGELREFVERTDVLVCLLPLTPETQGACAVWVNGERVGDHRRARTVRTYWCARPWMCPVNVSVSRVLTRARPCAAAPDSFLPTIGNPALFLHVRN